MTDLLPCPFCGKQLERNADFSTRGQDHFTHPPLDDGEEPCVIETINLVDYHDKSRGHGTSRVEGWNRRAEPVASQTEEDLNHLQEIADGAWGDDPRTRGLARDRLKELGATPEGGE